ncbi:dephospho-CoA kinase [Candidatus Pelagibacter sp.]|nr:dephospho-CoA kinase [Candidatus Pelagibacter sp.]
MIRIGILGAIGSGKSYVAKNFGYPVFNADNEVSKLYQKNRKVYYKLKKILPEYIYTFPIDKIALSRAILVDNSNLQKIIRIVHKEITNKMRSFISKNKNKKFVILDIPLLLENKINKKEDVLVYVEARKADIIRNLKKRKNFNPKILNKFKKIQLSLAYKKKSSRFIIKNKFTKKSVKDEVKQILKTIKYERNSS